MAIAHKNMNRFKYAILSLAVIMGLTLAGAYREQAVDSTNPFFSPYKTPLNTPPFNLIKTEHFLPAVKEGIR